MKNVTKKAGILTAVATAVGTFAPSAMAADALTFDTAAITAPVAAMLAGVAAIGAAYIIVPVAIKGWSYFKAMIFRA